ncbi:MAG TPA: hypothetical protein PKE65_03995 [Rhizobiaceae bacterium]|nr:hypothetical protein [Rhizobiaceae bacterium]
MRSFIRSGLLAAVAFGAAACTTTQEELPVARQPVVIEGSWIGPDSLYRASFNSQRTVWTDFESGAVLVRGSYRQISATDYSLILTSETSGRSKNATCRLSSPSVLNCTDDGGERFSMTRATSAV